MRTILFAVYCLGVFSSAAYAETAGRLVDKGQACMPCKTKCEVCPRGQRLPTVAACKLDCENHGGNPMVQAKCSAYGRGNC